MLEMVGGTDTVSTHSRPKAAGPKMTASTKPLPFQHTAARRRLVHTNHTHGFDADVSTHSRPKAAGTDIVAALPNFMFQHTAARRRLDHLVVV